MEVMRAAAQEESRGNDVIHMEVGQPGTPAPRAARKALEASLNKHALGYTLATGMSELRERIAQHYADKYNIHVASRRVIVTSGSSAAFVLAFLAIFDTGDHVALPTPGYPCYRQILKALGQIPFELPAREPTQWMPTPQQLLQSLATQNLRGLILASPANPTGTMISRERLNDLSQACKTNGLWLISDEIYHGLTYGISETCALETNANAIIINSFSKYYSMTGWRVGWMIVPDILVEPIERLAQNLYISPPAVSQIAALAAFDASEELEANKTAYAKNRELLLNELPTVGFTKFAPADGAFYLYCDVSNLADNSVNLASAILKDTAVATTPGVDFDTQNGKAYLRFSYAGTYDHMLEAVTRLKTWSRCRNANP